MKNTFTFPHDYGARNDPELQRVIFDYGPAAGFAYWVIIEMLYEQGGQLPKGSYNQIAYASHVDTEMIRNIVEGSSLFDSDGESFWSERVRFTLEMREQRAERSRTAAQASWANRKKEKELQKGEDANAIQMQSESNAKVMVPLCHNNNNNNSNNNSTNNRDNITPDISEDMSSPQTNSFEVRQIKFYNSLVPFIELYDRQMLRDFYNYWSEPDRAKKPKMRFEKEKTWSLERRLETWKRNEDKFGGKKSKGDKMWDNIKKNLEVLPFNDDGTINI